MNGVRVDKWLWSIRMFKSRTLATEACKNSRVFLSTTALKPSHDVRIGDLLFVYKDGFRLSIRVKDLLEKRVSASLAKNYYENLTSEDELNKYKAWFAGKTTSEVREKGTGRPTKLERRDIDEFKDNYMEERDDLWLNE